MEGSHQISPGASTDGEAMQVLHFDADKEKNAVLVPRQVFNQSYEWKPLRAEDVRVSQGDRIHFYYDRNGHEGNDGFHLRGTLTLTRPGGEKTVYNPGGEFTGGRQGGTTGVWFYRWDKEDATPNPDGKYTEISWQAKPPSNRKAWVVTNKKHGRYEAYIGRVARGGDWAAKGDLPDLKPGVYEATVSFYTADDEVLGRARQTFIRYDHQKDMPWIGNDLGKTNEVLPPWTPMESADCRVSGVGGETVDGYEVSCGGRDYRVDGSGLFTGIDVRSESGLDRSPANILAAPVQVHITRDGEPIRLQPEKNLEGVKSADNEVSWNGALEGEGLRIETDVRMDYDGYALHRLRIVSQDAGKDEKDLRQVDRIGLVVPLEPKYGTHLHAAAGEWFRSSVSSIPLGDKEGVLWHSGQNHGGGLKPHGKFGRLMTVGNFKPYVWVGGANRGIAFMADSDRGWVPDDSGKTPAIQVIRVSSDQSDHRSLITNNRSPNPVCLVLNLVARPFAFDHPREVTFSLQATPVKPVREDFRFRRRELCMASAFPGTHGGKGWAWTGQMFNFHGKWLFGLPGSAPYPVNWDKARWYEEMSEKNHFHGGEWVNTPYQSQLNVMTFPEVEDPRMPPGKQVSDVYGYIYPHMSAGHLEHGNPSMAQVDVDYRLWCYDAWIKEIGLEGLYFDQTEPVLAANPKAGFGYRLDLHDRPKLDGRIQPGYGLSRVRQFYRRLRGLFVQHGHDPAYLWLHTTDANMISAFAFVDYFLEGENNPRISEKHPWVSEKIPPARMQAMHNGAGKWGAGMTQLPMYDSAVYKHTHPMHDAIVRCMEGYLMLHDVEDHNHGVPWKGMDLKEPAVFLPYWDRNVSAGLATGQEGIFAGGYRRDAGLTVVVFNTSGDARPEVKVTVVPRRLGMTLAPGQLVVEDAENGKKLPGVSSTDKTVVITLNVDGHDYRMIEFRRKKDEEGT
jgi:hypothetical protein